MATPSLTCDHCLVPFPGREAVRASIEGEDRVFCCPGCLGVFELVHAEGLGSFYTARAWEGPGRPVSSLPEADVAAFRETVRRVSVEGSQETVTASEIDLLVEGIRCASCVWLNERLLKRTRGVTFARVNYATHRARVRFDPEVATLEVVLARIRSAGYVPKPWTEGEQQRVRRAEVKDLLVRLGTACFLVSQLMIYQAALYAGYFEGIDLPTRRVMEWISLGLTLPVLLYSGAPFLRATWGSLRNHAFGMDALVVFGSWSALAYSLWQMTRGGEVYFDTAAMIPTLVLVGRFVEAVAKGRASEAVSRLAALIPSEATRITVTANERETVTRVPLSLLKAGDLLRVVPGDRVPADGVVRSGCTEVDESLVTGEARPVAKTPGSRVIGGTTNGQGSIDVEVTQVGDRTVLSGIVRAVEEAQMAKPRIQRFADRVVGVFVPAMLLIASGTMVAYLARGASVDRAVMTGIAVMVIACPCALGLATPIAVLVATGLASSRGILVRGGDVFERAARVDEVLLDKTGTVTRGKPVLKEIVPETVEMDPAALLSLAAAIESRSEHHVGRAVVEAAQDQDESRPEVLGFRALAGRGVAATVNGDSVLLGNRALLSDEGVALADAVDERARSLEGQGYTVALLAVRKRVVGLVVVADVVREEAASAIAQLRRAGLSPSIVSGDNRATTESVARGLGLEAISQASPVEKREVVVQRQKAGRRVLFAGDGLNDAPALSQADVGVAVGRGAEVTLESADAVLVRDDLRLLAELVLLSRRASRVVKQNIFWAFAYNVTAIPLAVSGVLHPVVAAGAMAASSLFVILNSLRLRKARF